MSNTPEKKRQRTNTTNNTNTMSEEKFSQDTLRLVDTHVHLWDPAIQNISWLSTEDCKSISAPHLIKDYKKATENCNVVRGVYMEVDVDPNFEEWEKEAALILPLCEEEDNVLCGAVLGGDPSMEGFRDYVKKLQAHKSAKYLKGFRLCLQERDRPRGLCLKERFVENVQWLGSQGLSFDLVIPAEWWEDAITLVKSCPKTSFIIDHCANADMTKYQDDKEALAMWAVNVQRLSAFDNTVMKLSGIVATAPTTDWVAKDLAPYINTCIATFGEDRCFFAGDWPVCTFKSSFENWVKAIKEVVQDRSPACQRKLFHDNAVKVYAIGAL